MSNTKWCKYVEVGKYGRQKSDYAKKKPATVDYFLEPEKLNSECLCHARMCSRIQKRRWNVGFQQAVSRTTRYALRTTEIRTVILVGSVRVGH